MRLPVRNHLTKDKVIMCWCDAATARVALAEGPRRRAAQKAAAEYAREQLAAASAAVRQRGSLLQRAAELGGRLAHDAARDDHDMLATATDVRPTASEKSLNEIGRQIQRLDEAWVDIGDGHLFATPEEAVEYYSRYRPPSVTGPAAMYEGIRGWEGLDIDDEPGYVLEDGRRFASAAEAQKADDKPRRDAKAAKLKTERAAIASERIAAGVADSNGNIRRGTMFHLPIGQVELTGRASGRSVEVRFPSVPRREAEYIGLQWFAAVDADANRQGDRP